MSAVAEVINTPENTPSSWGLWLRQIGAILRLELAKNFFSRRSILIYLIALLPIFPLILFAFVQPDGNEWNFNFVGMIYAILYHNLILRTVIFFGCAW